MAAWSMAKYGLPLFALAAHQRNPKFDAWMHRQYGDVEILYRDSRETIVKILEKLAAGRVFAILLALRGIHSILSGGAWGFMSLLIAWMIWKEGWREYQQVLAEERWTKWSQGDFNARVSPPPYEQ